VAQQRLAIDECGLVGHGGYRSKLSDSAHEGLECHRSALAWFAAAHGEAALSCPQSTNQKALNATSPPYS
jgi:hypothetical protein